VKRSHLVLAVALALAAGLGQAALGAMSKGTAPPGVALARGKIGSAAPSAGAAARIRALGLDDGGGLGSDDAGGLGADDGGGVMTSGGHAARAMIGNALPRTGAAARIAALGLDD
jgi:hypothetical protein